MKNCPYCDFPNPDTAEVCRLCGKTMDSSLRRTFSALALGGWLLIILAATLSLRLGAGSLKVQISSLTLWFTGIGLVIAIAGLIGRSMLK